MFIVNSIVTGLFLINKVVFVIVKKGKRECTKLTLARMWVAYKPRYVETLLEMPSKSRVVCKYKIEILFFDFYYMT